MVPKVCTMAANTLLPANTAVRNVSSRYGIARKWRSGTLVASMLLLVLLLVSSQRLSPSHATQVDTKLVARQRDADYVLSPTSHRISEERILDKRNDSNNPTYEERINTGQR